MSRRNELKLWSNNNISNEVMIELIRKGTIKFEELESDTICRKSTNFSALKQEYNNLLSKDKETWINANQAPTIEKLKDYLEKFPFGLYSEECKKLINDNPWYMNNQNESMETTEIDKILGLESPVERVETVQYESEDYQKNYSNTIIDNNSSEDNNQNDINNQSEDNNYENNSNSEKTKIINDLKQDINCYNVLKIKDMINNKQILDWDDLKNVFDQKEIEQIKKYVRAPIIGSNNDSGSFNKNDEIENNSLEVYFWGLRGTGKTCAIGATIDSLSGNKSIKYQEKKGGLGKVYFNGLKDIFKGEYITLPGGTENGILPKMHVKIKDDENKWHAATIIDVAGEVFSDLYVDDYGKKTDTTKKLEEQLKDSTNYKIHFFIVEYNCSDTIELMGITNYKSTIMNELVEQFDKDGLFDNRTIGMYILTTKCDSSGHIDDSPERKECVMDFYNNDAYNWNKFCNKVLEIRERAITDTVSKPIISFSIGKVFAKDLCKKNVNDAKKISERIVSLTHGYSDNWWTKLLNRIRNN